MKFDTSFIDCNERLVKPLPEVQEIFTAISAVPWQPSRVEAVSRTGKKVYWQEAYNRLFEIEFEKLGWKLDPILCEKPLHKGDFFKNDVFVEIQFGNSATIYRDYYKFHYGFVNKLLSLGVLILPTNQYKFFPQRNPQSIGNMATYEYALEHFNALTIPVPILLIGLRPAN